MNHIVLRCQLLLGLVWLCGCDRMNPNHPPAPIRQATLQALTQFVASGSGTTVIDRISYKPVRRGEWTFDFSITDREITAGTAEGRLIVDGHLFLPDKKSPEIYEDGDKRHPVGHKKTIVTERGLVFIDRITWLYEKR